MYNKFNFQIKDQLTKKKDQILIKDLISYKWKIKQKKQGWFSYSREYIYIYQYVGRHGLPFWGSYIIMI